MRTDIFLYKLMQKFSKMMQKKGTRSQEILFFKCLISCVPIKNLGGINRLNFLGFQNDCKACKAQIIGHILYQRCGKNISTSREEKISTLENLSIYDKLQQSLARHDVAAANCISCAKYHKDFGQWYLPIAVQWKTNTGLQ